MAQLIQHKRGALERLASITGSLKKGEILIVTGSSNITSSNGSSIVFAATISVVAAGTGFVTTGSFHAYTSSLGNTFATDAEVYQTASAIIDQGEF